MKPNTEQLEIHLQRIEKALNGSQYDLVYELAINAHSTYPKDLQLIDLVRISLVRLGRPLEALDFLDSLDSILKDELQIRVSLAHIHLELNDLGLAQELWSEYKDHPKHARPLLVNALIARVLQKVGRPEDLLRFVKANLFAKENFVDVLVIAGDAAYQIKEWGILEEIVQELEAWAGTIPLVNMMRARILMNDGRYQEAREHLDHGLSVLPNEKALLVDKARLQVLLGEVQDAKERFFLLFNAYPDEPILCMNLALLPAYVFTAEDPTAVMFLDRMMYLLIDKPLGALPTDQLMELLRGHGRDIGYFNLNEQFPSHGSGTDPTVGDVLRNVLPFVFYARSLKTPVDHGSDLAHLIIESYLGQPASCYKGIDDVLMKRDVEPSAMQDYYYALTAAQIIEEHSAVAPASLARARRTMQSSTASPSDLYYAMLLIAFYNGQEEALTRLKILRGDHRWNALLHLLELRIVAEQQQGFLESEAGTKALKELVDHMHREKDCYFVNPTPVLIPEHGRDILESVTPLFQFMENLELLSHVSEFVRSFQKDRMLNEVFFVRGSIFSALLRFEAYEKIRSLELAEEGKDHMAPAAVDWIAEQLKDERLSTNVETRAQVYQNTPADEILKELGDAIFNAVTVAKHRKDAAPANEVIALVKKNYVLAATLHQRNLLDIEQYLTFQQYCRYTLEELVRTDTSLVQNEFKGRVDQELLDLLKQLDIIATALELAIGPVRPFYWLCSKGISAITKSQGAELFGDKFLSFAGYTGFIAARRSKEAA